MWNEPMARVAPSRHLNTPLRPRLVCYRYSLRSSSPSITSELSRGSVVLLFPFIILMSSSSRYYGVDLPSNI